MEKLRLRRLVPGGASGNTPFGSPGGARSYASASGGRDPAGEAAGEGSLSDGSFSAVS